jgi:hypothetical protein
MADEIKRGMDETERCQGKYPLCAKGPLATREVAL